MTLYELLMEMGRSVQQVESDMAKSGEALFLRDYDDGKANTVAFTLPDGKITLIPSTTLKHHFPLGQKKVILETETDVTLNKSNLGNKEQGIDPSSINVNLKRGLFGKSARMRIHVEYETRLPSEGISRVHESLLDNVKEVPLSKLTPAKK